MIVADAPAIWLPPAPAVIRPAEQSLLRPGFLPATRAERRRAVADLIRSGRLTKQQAANALVIKLPPALAMLMVNQLIGFGAGGEDVQPATVTFIGTTRSGSDLTTYTFNDRDTGSPDPARTTVVGIIADDGATNFTIDSGTIGGVAATMMGTGASDTGSLINARFMGLANPSGTTATITVTMSEAVTGCAVIIWSVLNLLSLTPTAQNQAFQTSSAAMTLDVNTTADGVVLGIAGSSAGGETTTWTGLAEVTDDNNVDYNSSAADFDEDATPATPLAITCDYTGTADSVGKVIALR